MAISEIRNNQATESLGFLVSYSKGYTQCFCDQKALDGDKPEQTYEYDGE